jgi:hypothetical protein
MQRPASAEGYGGQANSPSMLRQLRLNLQSRAPGYLNASVLE